MLIKLYVILLSVLFVLSGLACWAFAMWCSFIKEPPIPSMGGPSVAGFLLIIAGILILVIANYDELSKD